VRVLNSSEKSTRTDSSSEKRIRSLKKEFKGVIYENLKGTLKTTLHSIMAAERPPPGKTRLMWRYNALKLFKSKMNVEELWSAIRM
jgi:hypothetical protein